MLGEGESVGGAEAEGMARGVPGVPTAGHGD